MQKGVPCDPRSKWCWQRISGIKNPRCPKKNSIDSKLGQRLDDRDAMTNHQRTDAYPEAETNRQQEVDHHQSRRIDFKRPSPEGNPKKYQNKNGTVDPCLEQSRSQKCVERTNSSIKKQLLPLRHPSQRLNSDLAKQIQQCDPAGEPDHWIQQICRSRPNQNPQCQKCENQGHGLEQNTPNSKCTFFGTKFKFGVCQRQDDSDLQHQAIQPSKNPSKPGECRTLSHRLEGILARKIMI